MRGISRAFAMLSMAAGFAIVPAMGSQGAGTLGERLAHADSRLIGNSTAAEIALQSADELVRHQLLKAEPN